MQFELVLILMHLHLTVLCGYCVRGLTRGLATLPSKYSKEPLVDRDWHGRPQEDPPGGALLLCV